MKKLDDLVLGLLDGTVEYEDFGYDDGTIEVFHRDRAGEPYTLTSAEVIDHDYEPHLAHIMAELDIDGKNHRLLMSVDGRTIYEYLGLR